MKLYLNKPYFVLTVLLFSTEILIAIFLKNGFIRHTFGDYLVVILMYCFFKSFIRDNNYNIALSVLVFSFVVEFLQLFNILKLLNLQNNHLTKLILGNTFHVSDLIAYTLGILTILILEHEINKYKKNS
jgi:hypothetical protein